MSDAAAATEYRSSRRRWAFLATALVIAVLPYVLTGSYWHTNLTICAINVLLALGLDFILGYAGQLNLGQSAFYGLGAYVSTLLITRLGVLNVNRCELTVTTYVSPVARPSKLK